MPSIHVRPLTTILSSALLALAFASAAQSQEIQWLPDGSEYSLRCSGDGAGERSYRLSRMGDGMKLERLGRDVYQAGPIWALLFTDIFDEFENGKVAKTMKFLSGDREGLKSLSPGTVSRGEYEWTRGRRANRTHTIKVEEKKVVKTEAFGDQEVVVVTDTVTGPIHNIRMETHYAPALKTFTWRRFENFGTRQRTECALIRIGMAQK